MKILDIPFNTIQELGRWDIDFHLPAEGINRFPKELLKRVDSAAEIVKDKRDPSKEPDVGFLYVDISSIDVSTGVITTPQEVLGEDAPSRARKVIRAFDIVISTCRPTRGAIAVVPTGLHDQIASTGFSIIRPKTNVNPYYLHYALRLPSTLEQFRKWSTGSSYPAILDEDVAKTLIPIPNPKIQDLIAEQVMNSFFAREETIKKADHLWFATLDKITESLTSYQQLSTELTYDFHPTEKTIKNFKIENISNIIKDLPPVRLDNGQQKLLITT